MDLDFILNLIVWRNCKNNGYELHAFLRPFKDFYVLQ